METRESATNCKGDAMIVQLVVRIKQMIPAQKRAFRISELRWFPDVDGWTRT
jgi:hypothetical protein